MVTRKKPFRFKVERLPEFNDTLNRPEVIGTPADPIPLTGILNKKNASDIEERFGRALRKNAKQFNFQVDIALTDDNKKNVDFLVNDGFITPVETYGEIGHNSDSQRSADAVREARLNEYFARQGVQPLRIVWWYQIPNQEVADQLVREMFS